MAPKYLPWSIRIHKNSDIYKKQFTIYKDNWDSNSTKMGDRCSLNYDIIHLYKVNKLSPLAVVMHKDSMPDNTLKTQRK